jgi:hypothetical protein
LALVAAASPARASDLVVNGSFEQPVVATGSFLVTTALPGWTVSGVGVEIQNNIAFLGGTAYDGAQYVELDSTANSCMQQVVPTIAGQKYTLIFAYSPRPHQLASTNEVDVKLNGTLIAALAQDGTANSHSAWSVQDYAFTAAGPTTLQFCAAGTSDGVGGWIDDVLILPAQSGGVPAAGGAAIAALAGLILLVGARAVGRRRRHTRPPAR